MSEIEETTPAPAAPATTDNATEKEAPTKEVGKSESDVVKENGESDANVVNENGNVEAEASKAENGSTEAENGKMETNGEAEVKENGEAKVNGDADTNGEPDGGPDGEPDAKKRKIEENGDAKEEDSAEKQIDKDREELQRKKEEFAKEAREKEKASFERKSVAEKCPECDYKCWTDAEMKIHRQTSHGSAPRRMRMCANCNFQCQNTWEMDYHARSRGHKAKEVITCKKCDFLCETKEESWEHKKIHIPLDKLFECGDCSWCSERLDNMRYHAHSQDHKTKHDYEEVARSRAEARGPKDLKNYHTKLARDIKKAQAMKKK